MDDVFTVVEELDATTVSSLIAIFIPALTALITKWDAPSWIRTVVAFLLSAITAAGSTLVSGDGDFDWKTFALSTLFAFVTNIAMYVGVYKPQGIAKGIAAATPRFGLGPKPTQLRLIHPLPPDSRRVALLVGPGREGYLSPVIFQPYETRARGQRVKVLGIDKDAAFVRYLEGLGGGHSTAWVLLDELEDLPQSVDKPVEAEIREVVCRCRDQRDGFSMAPELGMYVHARCGKPTSAALAAETGEIWREA